MGEACAQQSPQTVEGLAAASYFGSLTTPNPPPFQERKALFWECLNLSQERWRTQNGGQSDGVCI